jgi:hypothetical protein
VRTVRQRHARVSRRRERGGHAWDDFERDASFDERFGLFAAAAKYKRIAAFESDDFFAFAGQEDKRALDVPLRAAKAAALFSDKHALGVGPGQRENFRGHQIVMHNRIGLADQPKRLEGQQLGIPWAGTNEENRADVRKSGMRGNHAIGLSNPRASARRFCGEAVVDWTVESKMTSLLNMTCFILYLLARRRKHSRRHV